MAREKSHGFSRVAEEPWGVFSSFSGNGHSKLVLVQRRQEYCLVTRDTSGISTRLDSKIRTLLEERRGPSVSF